MKLKAKKVILFKVQVIKPIKSLYLNKCGGS